MSAPISPVLGVLGEELSGVLGALGSPVRLSLVLLVAQAPRTIEALAGLSGHSPALVSFHLKALRAAGILHATKKGRELHHTLPPESARFITATVAFVSASSPRLREAVAEAEGSAPLTVPPPGAVVVDVRLAEEFRAGHRPGAIGAPLAELAGIVVEAGAAVWCYGRGRFCPLPTRAVAILRARGVDAHPWRAGVLEWLAAGEALAGA